MKKKKKHPGPGQKVIDEGTKRLSKFWKDLTPEEREAMSRKLSESLRRFWEKMTVEQEREFRLRKGRLVHLAFQKKSKEEQRRQMWKAWVARGIVGEEKGKIHPSEAPKGMEDYYYATRKSE